MLEVIGEWPDRCELIERLQVAKNTCSVVISATEHHFLPPLQELLYQRVAKDQPENPWNRLQ